MFGEEVLYYAHPTYYSEVVIELILTNITKKAFVTEKENISSFFRV